MNKKEMRLKITELMTQYVTRGGQIKKLETIKPMKPIPSNEVEIVVDDIPPHLRHLLIGSIKTEIN